MKNPPPFFFFFFRTELMMHHCKTQKEIIIKMWLLVTFVSLICGMRQVKEKQSAFCTQSAIHSFIEHYT